MAKTLHSRHNKIFLKMLRELRESRGLRQSDLAELLGRSQATVSNVERGERRLDVIELRDWLDALDERFPDFTTKLDAELLRLGGPRLRIVHKKGSSAQRVLNQMLRVVRTGK
jgi:transcriptional regulator with XRE-family HTH domain